MLEGKIPTNSPERHGLQGNFQQTDQQRAQDEYGICLSWQEWILIPRLYSKIHLIRMESIFQIFIRLAVNKFPKEFNPETVKAHFFIEREALLPHLRSASWKAAKRGGIFWVAAISNISLRSSFKESPPENGFNTEEEMPYFLQITSPWTGIHSWDSGNLNTAEY